jgi:hypothetical protein
MKTRLTLLPFAHVLIAVCLLVLARSASGQTPSLLWSTNVAGRVFTADAQTNVYVQAGGSVIVLNGTGVPTQTDVLSTNTGVAARDEDGNYYYAGIYPPTSGPPYGVNYSDQFFLAKYGPGGGAPLWSVDYGSSESLGRSASVTDLQVESSSGSVYVAFLFFVASSTHDTIVVRYNSDGSKSWASSVPPGTDQGGPVKLGGLGATNGWAIHVIAGALSGAALSRFDAVGNFVQVANWSLLDYVSFYPARPIGNGGGEVYNVEGDPRAVSSLVKRRPSGDPVWSKPVAGTKQFTVGWDQYGGVHVADQGNKLYRYDFDGALVWTMSLPSVCTAMVLDASGNRFISMADGTVARLSDETVSGPVISAGPRGQTVLAGSNVTFTVTASGSGPLRYLWRFNGTPISGQTNTSLTLSSVSSGQSGNYSVIASNFLGSVTSSPALLRVKSVALFIGNQMLTNGTYMFATQQTLSIKSTYPSGSSFYTLDGSTPSFTSTLYSGAFVVSHSATVRAIGYSADFSQSEEADAANINIVVLTNHTLRATSSGGGTVTLNPPGGTYVKTNVVTVTAVPSNGWSFLYWLGDAPGNSASINVSMERDKSVYAVFGTTLSTTVSGNGQVQLSPPGGLYPYGTVVRVTGVPQPGNYFGFWGNAATGNSNPLYFTVNGATPTISSIFGATSAGQSALTILINGAGRVSQSPAGNVFSTSQTVMLTAMPDAGQTFVNWSGDASGTQNPLSLSMSQNRVVTANFSDRPRLRVDRPGLEGLTPEGFRFTIVSDPGEAWNVFGSGDLKTWNSLGTVTNSQGEAQFLDSAASGFDARFYRTVLVP